MEKVCAWCGKTIGEVDSTNGGADAPVSHGICPDCFREAMSHRGERLRDCLDRFSDPVFLVDSSGRIIAANSEAFSTLGKAPEELGGQLCGDAFDCRYAGLPGGCGRTTHCKTCTIRLTITDTMESGKSHTRVPAYPDLHHKTGERDIRYLISTEKSGDAVVLRIDDISAVAARPS